MIVPWPLTPAKIWTGSRKEAVARVRLMPGDGDSRQRPDARRLLPDRACIAWSRFAVALGGSREGLRRHRFDPRRRHQRPGGAVKLGIARALIELDPELRAQLKAEGYLTRDAREKERRKYGLKKARKAPQYSKR